MKRLTVCSLVAVAAIASGAARADDLFDANIKRPFNSISEMDEEHRNVRVWGGIHFRNSLDVGYDMGRKDRCLSARQRLQAGALKAAAGGRRP